jgi:hypothetical protein
MHHYEQHIHFGEKHIHFGVREIGRGEQEKPIFDSLRFHISRRQTDIQNLKDKKRPLLPSFNLVVSDENNKKKAF